MDVGQSVSLQLMLFPAPYFTDSDEVFIGVSGLTECWKVNW